MSHFPIPIINSDFDIVSINLHYYEEEFHSKVLILGGFNVAVIK